MRKMTLNRLWTLGLALLALAVFAGPVSAQDGQHPPQPPKQNRQEKKKQIREKIETVQLVQLVQALDLNDEQSLKINKVLKEQKDKRESIIEKKKEAIKKLRELVDKENPDETAIKSQITDIKGLEKTFMESYQGEFAQVSQHLSVVQQGKYLLFQHEFRQKLRRVIHDQRKIQGDEPGKGNDRPGKPGHDPAPAAGNSGPH